MIVNELKACKVTHGDTVAYFPNRREVFVEDGKSRFVIRKGGNSKDGQHRWARFRDWAKCGGWQTAADIKNKAMFTYGHAVTPWIGGQAPVLPEYAGRNWATAQRIWRQSGLKTEE